MIYLYLNNLEGGGVVKIHLNIMRGLSRAFEFRTVLNSFDGIYTKEIKEISRINPVALNTRSILKKIHLLLKIIKGDENPIFFVGNGQEAVICILVKLMAPRTKIFYVQHVDLSLPQVSSGRNALRILLFLIPSVFADKLVVVSDSLKNSIVRKIPFLKNRIIRIYNPVLLDDVPVFDAAMSPYKTIGKMEEVNIVSVGRLSYQKGYDFLINVAEKLVEKGLKNFKINIVGDGELKEHLISSIHYKNLEDKFRFFGWQADSMKFIAHADLYVLHSRWEGLPTVLIEAVAAAKRIVAYNCPHGVGEILKSGKLGDVIENFDADIFADAIIKSLLKKPRKIEKTDFESFTFERAYQAYSKHFTELVH